MMPMTSPAGSQLTSLQDSADVSRWIVAFHITWRIEYTSKWVFHQLSRWSLKSIIYEKVTSCSEIFGNLDEQLHQENIDVYDKVLVSGKLETHIVRSCPSRNCSGLIIRVGSFNFLHSFYKDTVSIWTAWVPPEEWLILMQVTEQMLSKKVLFHSFHQVMIIIMLSKYSVNEARKTSIMLMKQVFGWNTWCQRERIAG